MNLARVSCALGMLKKNSALSGASKPNCEYLVVKFKNATANIINARNIEKFLRPGINKTKRGIAKTRYLNLTENTAKIKNKTITK